MESFRLQMSERRDVGERVQRLHKDKFPVDFILQQDLRQNLNMCKNGGLTSA